jgi:hypothetical protein
MSTGAVFFAHKQWITERNSHLAGEASGSFISNGCQAKTERRRQLAGVGTGRGGTKLHASVAGSRVTAFLEYAAPWEPPFTDNPHIYLYSKFHTDWFSHSKVNGGDKQTHRQLDDRVGLFVFFFHNKKRSLFAHSRFVYNQHCGRSF